MLKVRHPPSSWTVRKSTPAATKREAKALDRASEAKQVAPGPEDAEQLLGCSVVPAIPRTLAADIRAFFRGLRR